MNIEDLIKLAKKEFKKISGEDADFVAVAPGRINIIGEHTDYNEGLSMPAGINRWVVTCGKKRKDNQFHVVSRDFNDEFWFDLSTPVQPVKTWQKFVYGAINIFAKQQAIDDGLDFYIMGNIPLGSGVSSSAGLVVSLFNFFREAYRSNMTDIELVLACQATEHQYLQVPCGIMDQYASQFSKKGNYMVLDFRNKRHEYIEEVKENWVWILVDTKVKRELASSKYAERVNETSEAFQIISNSYPLVSHMRDITIGHLEVLKERKKLHDRMLHYVRENERVEKAIQVLKKKDAALLGNLLLESHFSLKDYYEVSCDELDFLVELAGTFNGCYGSRMMGGGFGGCTINLVEKSKAELFNQYMIAKYKEKFNIDTECHTYEVADGAYSFSTQEIKLQ